MNTEITDNIAERPVGWIFFDAECRFCVGHRQRWGRTFERRGFVWLPLQTPGTADRLGITEAQLRAEMWLQLADGQTFSGVDAWSVQMRRVWWLWPLALVLVLPGFKATARALYRWIAKNRHCLSGTCSIHAHGRTATPGRRSRLIAGL